MSLTAAAAALRRPLLPYFIVGSYRNEGEGDQRRVSSAAGVVIVSDGPALAGNLSPHSRREQALLEILRGLGLPRRMLFSKRIHFGVVASNQFPSKDGDIGGGFHLFIKPFIRLLSQPRFKTKNSVDNRCS